MIYRQFAPKVVLYSTMSSSASNNLGVFPLAAVDKRLWAFSVVIVLLCKRINATILPHLDPSGSDGSAASYEYSDISRFPQTCESPLVAVTCDKARGSHVEAVRKDEKGLPRTRRRRGPSLPTGADDIDTG